MSIFYSAGNALRKLRKNPGHTATMILTFSLGVTAWTSANAARDSWRQHPTGPAGRDYRVELPRPDGEVPAVAEAGRGDPLAFRDRVLLESQAPVRATDFFISTGAVRAASGEPTAMLVAFSTREVGAIFGITLAAGAFWSERGDRGEEKSIVVDRASARALFGDRDPIGERAVVYGEPFVVVGLLADPPGARPQEGRRPLIMMPSEFAARYHARPISFKACADPGVTTAEFFASDSAWIDFWVELDGPDGRARFQRELDEYASTQRALGRALEAPRLVSRLELARAASFDGGTELFALFSAALLAAVSLHLARFLDVKFRANRAETAIRRAFGASRGSVFTEHLLEAAFVGLWSAVLSVPLTAVTLAILNRWIAVRPSDYHMGVGRAAIGATGAIGLALVAGVIPSLRASRAVAAEGLRRT
jgi:putative ABC transport system permease protein